MECSGSLLAEEPTRVSVGKTEEFFVDDFLDLSKGCMDEEEEEDDDEEEEEEDGPPMAVSEEKKADFENDHGGFILKDEYCNTTTTSTTTTKTPGSELAIPADDLADLEWLSHFVEDSFSEYSLPYTAAAGGTLLPEKIKRPPEPEPEPEPRWCIGPIPARARSRRGRHGGRGWSAGCLSGGGGEASSSSASSSSSTSGTPQLSITTASLPWLTNGSSDMIKKEHVLKRPKVGREEGDTAGGGQGTRRCSHCLVQKTPQWRAGPKGAKTLCNACGVRYKSGRLLPEYRPACSPTFSSDLHSNNHRKVMEMRRRKETATAAAPAVWSF